MYPALYTYSVILTVYNIKLLLLVSIWKFCVHIKDCVSVYMCLTCVWLSSSKDTPVNNTCLLCRACWERKAHSRKSLSHLGRVLLTERRNWKPYWLNLRVSCTLYNYSVHQRRVDSIELPQTLNVLCVYDVWKDSCLHGCWDSINCVWRLCVRVSVVASVPSVTCFAQNCVFDILATKWPISLAQLWCSVRNWL